MYPWAFSLCACAMALTDVCVGGRKRGPDARIAHAIKSGARGQDRLRRQLQVLLEAIDHSAPARVNAVMIHGLAEIGRVRPHLLAAQSLALANPTHHGVNLHIHTQTRIHIKARAVTYIDRHSHTKARCVQDAERKGDVYGHARAWAGVGHANAWAGVGLSLSRAASGVGVWVGAAVPETN
jgi:hypothetical protein